MATDAPQLLSNCHAMTKGRNGLDPAFRCTLFGGPVGPFAIGNPIVAGSGAAAWELTILRTNLPKPGGILQSRSGARQTTEQQKSVLKRLDRGTKLPQLSGDGILLGECRFNLDRTAISEAIEKRDA